MSVTLGPFLACFIITLFLAGYLYIAMHRSTVFIEHTIQFSLIGILIILIRMAIPLNFPFTYTIYSYQILPRLIQFSIITINGTDLQIGMCILILWFTVAAILIIKLFIQYFRFHRYLTQFYIENCCEWAFLFDILKKHYAKPVKIAIIPEPLSPAITGLFHPTLILPDIKNLSLNELDYICQHEIAHYKKHHVWMGLLMEFVCKIHWWNPLILYLKKEFALFLELSNDFFLIQSSSAFNITNYAELIVKTAKNVQANKQLIPSTFMNFAVNTPSVLTTRINFILNQGCSEENRRKKSYFFNRFIICFAIFLSIFFVPEASFREITSAEPDEIEITEDNAYIIEQNNVYSLYVDGEHFIDLDAIPEDFVNLPLYK